MTFIPSDRTAETGSILFWIFIAVALFGALSFTVANLNRSGQQGGMDELAKMRATDIMQYSSAIQRSIRLMRINNVDQTELCFHTAQWGHTNYEFNPPCSDYHNRVFHPSGGGIGFQNSDADWIDSTVSITDGGQWLFSARYEVDNVGTKGGTANSEDANVDLLMALAPINNKTCQAINRLLGYDPVTPPDVPAETYDDLRTNKFTGTYTGETGRKIGDFGRERCVNVPATPNFNLYYKVILAQ